MTNAWMAGLTLRSVFARAHVLCAAIRRHLRGAEPIDDARIAYMDRVLACARNAEVAVRVHADVLMRHDLDLYLDLSDGGGGPHSASVEARIDMVAEYLSTLARMDVAVKDLLSRIGDLGPEDSWPSPVHVLRLRRALHLLETVVGEHATALREALLPGPGPDDHSACASPALPSTPEVALNKWSEEATALPPPRTHEPSAILPGAPRVKLHGEAALATMIPLSAGAPFPMELAPATHELVPRRRGAGSSTQAPCPIATPVCLRNSGPRTSGRARGSGRETGRGVKSHNSTSGPVGRERTSTAVEATEAAAERTRNDGGRLVTDVPPHAQDTRALAQAGGSIAASRVRGVAQASYIDPATTCHTCRNQGTQRLFDVIVCGACGADTHSSKGLPTCTKCILLRMPDAPLPPDYDQRPNVVAAWCCQRCATHGRTKCGCSACTTGHGAHSNLSGRPIKSDTVANVGEARVQPYRRPSKTVLLRLPAAYTSPAPPEQSTPKGGPGGGVVASMVVAAAAAPRLKDSYGGYVSRMRTAA